MQHKLSGLILFLLCFSTVTLLGQKNVNSPYSRFNIGSLNPSGSFRSLSMGGTGVAMRDNNSVYFDNPASYSSVDTISFIFDFGVDYAKYQLDNGTSKFSTSDLNFNHLLMAFPVSKRIGIATGLVPLSNGYYYLTQSIKSGDPNYDPITGEVNFIHQGSGSLSKYFLGTGIRVIKNLSVGINMNVIFGELTRLNQFEFVDYTNSYNQNGKENLRINGINFDYGLQYSARIKKNYFVTAGFSYTPRSNLSSSLTKLTTRFTAYNFTSNDTLSYTYSHPNDSTKFPASFKTGISFGKTDKFVVEVDYAYTKWAEGMIHGMDSSLANTSAWMFGIEFIPDKYSNSSFLNRVEYRLGGHISDNYLRLKGVQLKEYGVSCGLGFSMRKTLSKATIFFDYTRRVGDLTRGLHNENIYSAGISLNLYERWFLKRKYE